MTLADEDVNPKLVDVAAFADADSEERVDHWLVTADSLATAGQGHLQSLATWVGIA